MYVIHKLVEAFKKPNKLRGRQRRLLDVRTLLSDQSSSSTHAIFSKVMWYIVPVMNPDGYMFSRTDFRLWRKNRRRAGKLTL